MVKFYLQERKEVYVSEEDHAFMDMETSPNTKRLAQKVFSILVIWDILRQGWISLYHRKIQGGYQSRR
jgi:hypothetical protein